MSGREYRFVARFMTADGRSLDGERPLDIDWSRAVECVLFEGIRRETLEHPDPGTPPVIEPEWDAALGQPLIRGFRLELRDPDERKFGLSFPLNYFSEAVRRASSWLVDRGLLTPGETFRYQLAAYRGERRRRNRVDSFAVEELAVDPLIRSEAIEAYDDQGGGGSGREGDVPAFVPAAVLDEMETLTKGAGAKETGGVLIGHLNRDPRGRDLFLVVTAQIPAPHTLSTSTQLTFTSETWAAVTAAVELRRRGEVQLGWWHCHPAIEWCRDCPPDRRAACAYTHGFFSPEDANLHRTIFPKAYSVALVTTHSEAGIRHDMFGWRKGAIARRDFRVFIAVGGPPRSEERIPIGAKE